MQGRTRNNYHQRYILYIGSVTKSVFLYGTDICGKVGMITIKCAACKRKILKYKKMGKGKVLKCYKDRIAKYYVPVSDTSLICPCGQVIGTDIGLWIKMKQGAFEYSGTITRK